MNQVSKYLLTLAFLFITSNVISQNYTLSHRVIDSENGLLGTRLNSFYEDKDGFVWLATQRGVARYDGHQFKWFTEINSNLRGTPEKDRLVEDDEGNLWSVIIDKIDIINTKTFEIQSIEEKLGHDLPFQGQIEILTYTKDKYLFLKLNDSKRWYYYHSSIGFKELKIGSKKIEKIEIEGNKLWIYHADGDIFLYDYKKRKKLKQLSFINFRGVKPIKNNDPTKDLFWSINEAKQLKIYEVAENGLTQIMGFNTELDIDPYFVNLFYLPKSNLLVTNYPKEDALFSVVDIQNKQLIPIANSNNPNLFFGKIGWVSQEDIIWMRSKRSILLLQVKESHFQQYPPLRGQRGLKVIDNHIFASKFKTSLDPPFDTQLATDGKIHGTEPNLQNELWFGTGKSIIEVDIKTNEVKQTIPTGFKGPTLWSILRSQEGQWWAGSVHRGLFVSNSPQNDSLYIYEQLNEFEELKNNRIYHLLEDEGYVWVSSVAGLYLIDKNKGVIQRYNSGAPTDFRLPTSHVHFLHKDAANVYWLASSSEGLIRFEVNENFEITTFKRYSVEEGLSSNVVYCILEDDNEKLWLSTLNGISCFDKKTEAIQAFSTDDGIQELEFNRLSYAKADDGQLFFGSVKGITGFYPEKVINTDAYNFPIYISQFVTYQKQGDELIDETEKVQQSQKIVISPSVRFFRLNVAMLDIFNAKKLRYSYKIEGLFDEFQPIESNTIELGSLPYGRYTLVVRGQGADKRFSNQELVIPLTILRPFYRQWWFLLLLLILIGISGFQFYQWRIRQLEERKRELEILVMERTAQIRKDKTIIEKQATQLKELDELKSKFFANISHELRTPLTLLLAPMDSIFKSKELSNKNYTYLSMMRQNGKKLLKRINELLDLSRLDANRLEINEQPTFLYPFFKTLLSTVESAANLKGIQLLFKYQLDENIQVKLDDDKIEKIITNYLSNALKFTPKEGEIELNVSKKTDKLLISVSDTGIGILPNDLIKIFDRFYQTKKENQQQGTGIGLSLCRELAKVLNGRVWATSEINKGSIFYLELPLIETFAQKEAIPEKDDFIKTPILSKEITTSTAQKFRPNILIVEDNADLRQLLTMILQEDYNIVAVENGKEALRQLRVAGYELPVSSAVSSTNSGVNPQLATGNPQLIISDIMMPVMDGIELLTKLKKTEALQHIPVIMLTARQSLEVKIEALRIGVDDYLTKPFREDELKARVANLIENSQSRTEKPTQHISSSQSKTQKVIIAKDYEWLTKIEQAILKNIQDPQFKMTDLAAELAISYSLLKQKIKKITGLTPKQYERSIKLHKARQLLKSGKVTTVSEVMYQLGFEHLSYFSKIYKQEFGIMPSEELNGVS